MQILPTFYSGFLVSLEGGEGGGKTSLIPALVNHFREKGLSVFPTREPGGTSIGEQIRGVLHDLKNTEMDPRTETLLFQAARAQIVEQVIKPRLRAGEVVILDRYSDSTVAYQGYGHKQDINKIKSLVDFATEGLKPDLTILLDLDEEIGLERKRSQGEWTRMDAQTKEFHTRVRQGFLYLASEEPQRIKIIDASKTPLEIFEASKREIENALMARGILEGNYRNKER